MYVVTLTYTKPLDEVDQHRQAHLDWLRHHYESNHFVASGACMPRTGGVILAHTMRREELDALLEQDPFNQQGIAEYHVVYFKVTNAAPELQELLEA